MKASSSIIVIALSLLLAACSGITQTAGWAFSVIVGKIGIGLAVSAGLIAAGYCIPEVPWLTTNLRRGAIMLGVAIGALTFGYGWGAKDVRAAYKLKIEREIDNAKRKGDAARENSLRDFDALPDDQLPDDGFRRP